jgi:polyphosphate kinase 2 (PPK2 family)
MYGTIGRGVSWFVSSGIDTSGKDSLIREVLRSLILGEYRHSFKTPNLPELEITIIYEVHLFKACEKGKFGCFNRDALRECALLRVCTWVYHEREFTRCIEKVEDINSEFWIIVWSKLTTLKTYCTNGS